MTDRATGEGYLEGLVDQLRVRGVVRSDPLARAFAAIPRHCFLPPLPLERVYQIDQAIPTHFNGAGVRSPPRVPRSSWR